MKTSSQWMGYGLTHVGRVRETNQDSFLIDNKRGLWIVADGIGSHAKSGLASTLAVRTIQQNIENAPLGRNKANSARWVTLLKTAVIKANSTIRMRAGTEEALHGIGTTVVLVFMPDPRGQNAYIAHVGDSRAYLIRNQQLTALTRDHTMLEETIEVGLLPKTTSINHPLGHVLIRAVGLKPAVEPEISNLQFQPNDTILLCSDGLIKMMEDEQILEQLENPSPKTTQEKCQLLINETNRLGGEDNTTVVLIETKK